MRSFLLLTILMGWCLAPEAQEKSPPKMPVVEVEQLEVRDSSGKKYTMDEWTALLLSGKYDLRLDESKRGAILQKIPDSLYKAKMLSLPPPGESNSFVTGTEPESFSARTMAGKKVELSRLKGKVVVLNFWFVNCPPCRQEIPDLNQLTRDFAGQEVIFLGIARDDQSQLEQFLKETPFDYQQIASGSAIAAQYGIKGYPTHAVLGKDGKVVFQTMGLGPGTLFRLRNSIESALASPVQ